MHLKNGVEPDDTNVSATVPDWNRESYQRFWSPPKKLIKTIRDYQKYRCKTGIIANFLAKVAVLRHRFWSVICACDIPVDTQFGGGLRLIHPTGVVIHPEVEIGPNCLILQQVTLVKGVTLKGHVDIGAGAKIIKPVTIGAHAKIGANAVVVSDVPDYAVAVGIPAKIVK